MLLRKFFEILTLIGLSSAVTSKNGTVTANIPSLGPVNGNIEITGNGAIFMSFMGIPFAEPPVGDLRFQPPVVKTPWSGTWNATYERGCCYQMTSDRPEETEDCLYINVYTPTRTFKEGLPVMFYIYGGGFIEGYSERVNYGPEHLMEHEVILVTFNYRVGPFGFLSTGDTVIPGNLGLKDQLLALKWVNEHIQSFGGDPKKITLIGQSAGSASVMYHLLSPKSKGLFRAAIGESASALSAWAYQNNLPQLTHYLGTLINSDFKTKKPTSAELLKYLKSIPAKTIDAASLQLSNMNTPGYIQIEQGFYFTPTLEPEHEGAFLTGSMYHLFRSGNFTHVPTLMGVNTEECLFFADDPNQVAAFVRTFDETNNFLVPLGLRLSKKEDFDKVAKLIKDFYSPNAAFAANSRQLIKYFSDQGFARSIIKQALLQSKFSPVYFYQFAYHGVLGGHVSQSVAGFSEDVRHGEEMSFVITRSYGGYNTTDLTKYPLVDQLVQKRMINFFTNFVKYLNPTPNQETLFGNLKWPTVDPENFLYMNIGSELEIRRDPKNEMYQFWETIFNDFGQHLISY